MEFNDGILLLNKPQGMTSHDCVNRVRKLFSTKKVGHLGTLDPDVTGVLPICINQGTKIIPFIEHQTKEYIADITLGFSTTSLDASGEVLIRDESFKLFNRDQILQVLQSLIGNRVQTPPMLSAIKVNGKKLYEYYRSGKTVEIPKRTIDIYEAQLLSPEEEFKGETITFKVRISCSKGTYIRSLAVDIGEMLGVPSHMSHLIRSKAGPYPLNQCVTFEEIEKGEYKLISLLEALMDYPLYHIDESMLFNIYNGQKLAYSSQNDFKYLVLCDSNKKVVAIYEKDAQEGVIKPVRVLK